MYDCIVIGGGPAGMTASIYLSRYHLKVLVVDDGKSRAATIPLTHNHAGYPNGIRGRELLRRMRTQARRFGVELCSGTITHLAKTEASFLARGVGLNANSRCVLLATGVINRQPKMPQPLHRTAMAKGRIRYCPICDGYEVTDKHVAVVGTGSRGTDEAVFLRSFSRSISLVAAGPRHELSEGELVRLEQHGIKVIEGPIEQFSLTEAGFCLSVSGGTMSFDAVYPALGSDVRSELAAGLNARLTDDGCVKVDRHQRTSVPDLYAAGDLVAGLDQISNAMGQGGIAATAIRNDLALREPLLRK
jgi:thioredoxin reductase (NADPH)